MSLTFDQAVDDMTRMFSDIFRILPNTVHYPGKKRSRLTDLVPWLEYHIQHVEGFQSSLGGEGHRIYRRIGTITVKIFTPNGNGLSDSYALAKVAADVYEGQTSQNGVWFRRVRINEIGSEGTFHQLNMYAEFEYDEIK